MIPANVIYDYIKASNFEQMNYLVIFGRLIVIYVIPPAIIARVA